MNEKRTDYISWDEYFMAVAKLAGMRSKDPNSQVGSCIVSADNKILSDEFFAAAKEPFVEKYISERLLTQKL